MEAGKRVLPVLVGGADPLTVADVGPELGPLVNLHSVVFEDGKDLDDLVADLRSHLEDIDRERATLAGLDQPIPLPPIRFGPMALGMRPRWTGTAWTIPMVGSHELGRRARVLGELQRANTLSVAVLAVSAVPGVLSAGAIDRAIKLCECGDTYQTQEIFALGAFLSLLFVGVAVWGRARLAQSSIALESDLRELPPSHRRHAAVHLVTDGVRRDEWWMVAALFAPLIAAIAVIGWN